MTVATARAVRTARSDATIWSRVSEDDFRTNVVVLEELTNAVPTDVQIFPLEGEDNDAQRLPLKIEQQIADDIAYLTAVQQGAQSVAAVCLEQDLAPEAVLKIRVAAADSVDEHMRATMLQVFDILKRVSRKVLDEVVAAEELLEHIVKQHQYKILSRLRSRKWEKPRYLAASHKKPLWQDFENLIHRVHHIYQAKKEKTRRLSVENHLRVLAESYKAFEEVEYDGSVSHLRALVKSTYNFCKQSDVRQYAAQLNKLRSTAQIAAAVKCLRQLEKIGAYWRIAIDLVASAKVFPNVFNEIQVIYLQPYASVPASIAYESWAKTCHVHAEIQLVVEYDLQSTQHKHDDVRVYLPRVIGTSKYLCYLCYLFIKHHARFVVPNTHGRTYDQWTVPDLEEYEDTTREHYGKVLATMNEVLKQQADEKPQRRVEPMTSRQNLLQDLEQE